MIVSLYFGNPRLNRNLGNQMFELASLIGLAKRYDTILYLPESWQYAQYFKLSSFLNFESVDSFVTIEEPAFHCCLDFFDRFDVIIKNENINIEGYLQSENYWKPFEAEIRLIYTFEETLINKAQLFLIENNVDVSKYVAISVRRGDFVTDPYHYLLPMEYYHGAFLKHFPEKNIVVFSDDIDWCKDEFQIIDKEIIFSENKNGIEQLSLMSLFQNFIIANSTFSWWGAYLSAVNNKKVIRPCHHFDGELKQQADIKDHYPSEWKIYDYENDSGIIK